MNIYPLGLKLQGKRVVVVGGGAVATRRVPALLDAGALVEIVAPEITPALRGYADAGRIGWTARAFEPGDLDEAWFVQVAIDDRAAAEMVSKAAEQRRLFCVRADDRTAATAWTPAVTRHGEVTVAVTDAGDRHRALAVRDQVAAALDAGDRHRAREAEPREAARPAGREAAASAGRGREAAASTSREGAVSAGREGAVSAGREGAASAGREAAAAAGHEDAAPARRQGAALAGHEGVALVGAGPGDPELITVKGRRLLAAADVVVADRLVPGMLLGELRDDVELVDASKIPYGPQVAQEEINRVIVDRALRGRFVVRLKGGDPFVFGRGGEEVEACVEAGVPVRVVPGVTSSIAAPALAGIPVTHRGVTHEFTVVSGHVAPDHPQSLVNWSALARLRGTIVLMMGLKNLPLIAERLIAEGRDADTPVAVVQEGSTEHQRSLRATLGTVAGEAARAGIRPPAVVVIGKVVEIGAAADLA